jgi:hypothetical protein
MVYLKREKERRQARNVISTILVLKQYNVLKGKEDP